MKITGICTDTKCIRFLTASTGEVTVREKVPVIGDKGGRTLSTVNAVAKDGGFTLPRFDGRRDRTLSRFEVSDAKGIADGVRYVTEFAAGTADNEGKYPQPKTIKTLNTPAVLADKYPTCQSRVDVNLPHLMTLDSGGSVIRHEFQGDTYYFRREAVTALDAHVSAFPMTTFILLNSPRLFNSPGEKELLNTCIHPKFDWNADNAYISAFDMETEQGQNCYCAFVDFLCERYAKKDAQHGRLVGMIVSNEVDSQYIWGNAGEMSVEDYAAEYTQALRLTWLTAHRYCNFFRVYASLDQFWCGMSYDPALPDRYYSGRKILELVNANALRDGNFGWGVAYHPYPEDLRWPDFWHDRAPDYTFSTPKITFKNMEVLEAFLAQKTFLYHGKPRRIVFSEQGFNSQSGPLAEWTERMGYAGYVLAYMKARNMKTVDMFTHHSMVDNPREFGLNLGMFRYDKSKPGHLGEPKPVFSAYQAMDTPDESEAVRKAKEIIGDELFEYLLHPPVEHGERDKSKDQEFY